MSLSQSVAGSGGPWPDLPLLLSLVHVLVFDMEFSNESSVYMVALLLALLFEGTCST